MIITFYVILSQLETPPVKVITRLKFSNYKWWVINWSTLEEWTNHTSESYPPNCIRNTAHGVTLNAISILCIYQC